MKKLIILIGIAAMFSCTKESEIVLKEKEPIQYEVIFDYYCEDCNFKKVELAHGRYTAELSERQNVRDVTYLFKNTRRSVVPIDSGCTHVTIYSYLDNFVFSLEVEITGITSYPDYEKMRVFYETNRLYFK